MGERNYEDLEREGEEEMARAQEISGEMVDIESELPEAHQHEKELRHEQDMAAVDSMLEWQRLRWMTSLGEAADDLAHDPSLENAEAAGEAAVEAAKQLKEMTGDALDVQTDPDKLIDKAAKYGHEIADEVVADYKERTEGINHEHAEAYERVEQLEERQWELKEQADDVANAIERTQDDIDAKLRDSEIVTDDTDGDAGLEDGSEEVESQEETYELTLAQAEELIDLDETLETHQHAMELYSPSTYERLSHGARERLSRHLGL